VTIPFDSKLLDQLRVNVRQLGSANATTIISAVIDMAETNGVNGNPEKIAVLDQLLARLATDLGDNEIDALAERAVTTAVKLRLFAQAVEDRLQTRRTSPVAVVPVDLDALLQTITSAPPAALKVISSRNDLDENCTERLVEVGTPDVRRLVTRNLLAPLGKASQQILLDCARDDESLRVAMLRRPHLTEDVAANLLVLMNKRPRPDKGVGAALAKLDSGEQVEINRLLELSHRTSVNTHDPLSRDEIAQMHEAERASLDEVLILYIASGHPLAANALLAQLLRVTSKDITGLIGSGDEFGIAAVCRRLSLSPATFATIVRFKDKRHRIEQRPLNKLAASYFEHDPRKMAIFIRQFAPSMGEDVLPPEAATMRRVVRRKAAQNAHAS
jgi:hypothetical protein